MVKSTNIMGSGASGISNISGSSHNHSASSNNNNNNGGGGSNSNYNSNAGNINYTQNGVAGLASISGLMTANNFIGHRRTGSSGGSSIGNGVASAGSGVILDANATMRRKPRVAVSAQMEYRSRPNSMVAGYPPNAIINHNANYTASSRPTSIILGNGPMPNSISNMMPRYDTHRRTPSASRVQGVTGSLNPTSPHSPRLGSGYFPPHSPTHSPRSGSPFSPEVMLNGGRLVAGGIYSAGSAYENGPELDYDGDRSAVGGADMRGTGFNHIRTGSADMPMVRSAKTSGARVSRGNIIEIGAMSLATADDISDQYNSDILDDDDHDEEDDNANDIDTGSNRDVVSNDEGDHFKDDVDSDMEIHRHRDNDVTLYSPQNRARQMLQGAFARPRAFSETSRRSDSGESELSNSTRLSVRTDISLSRNHYNAHPMAYSISQQQASPSHLRSPNRPRPKSLVISNVVANNDAESDAANNEAIEARTNRKVLDLEISNKSLLAINQTLEQDLRKKTAEMEELKQKMRRANLEDIFGIKPSEEGESSGGEFTSLSPEGLTEEEITEDIPFQRVCALIELMRRETTAALEFTAILPGGRVLTAEELEDNLIEPNEFILTDTLPSTDDVAGTSSDPIESTLDVNSRPTSPILDTTSHTTSISNSTGLTRIRELVNVIAQRAIANEQGSTKTNTSTTTHLPQGDTTNITAIMSELETLLQAENTANRTTSTRKSSKGDTTRSSNHHSPPSSRTATRTPGPSEMRRAHSSQQTGATTATTSTSTRTFEYKRISSGGNTSTRGGRQAVAVSSSTATTTTATSTNNTHITTTNTSMTNTHNSSPRRTPSSRLRPTNATSTGNRTTSLTASTARAK